MSEAKVVKNAVYNPLKKLIEVINKLIEYVGLLMIVIMTCITIYQVILRFVFHNPTSWSEELSIFLMMWIGFLGVSVAMKERKHTTVEFLVDMMPSKLRKVILKIGDLLVLVFNILMVYYGFVLIKNSAGSSLPATNIPVGFMYMTLVVGGILNSLYGFIQVLGLEDKLFE